MNPRPADYKSAALPTELHQLILFSFPLRYPLALYYNSTPYSKCQHFFLKIFKKIKLFFKIPVFGAKMAFFAAFLAKNSPKRGKLGCFGMVIFKILAKKLYKNQKNILKNQKIILIFKKLFRNFQK